MKSVSVNTGGILLMVLVIVGMLTVMFIGSVGIVSRELHTTADATQKERIYQVAESGVQRILFLENTGYTLAQLIALNGTSAPITDPVSNAVVGNYTLVVTQPELVQGVYVESIAHSPDDRFCSKVSATIKSPSGSAAGPYFAYAWNRSVCPPDTTAPNPPVANPAGGTYNAVNVVLSAETNAVIYYTTDGSNPTVSSTVYSSAIPITISTVLKAIAVDVAGNSSTVMTETYTIDTTPPDAPVATPAGGTYSSPQNVTLTLALGEPGTTKIYYTLDSSTPTSASTLYSSAVTISGLSKTLKAIAIDNAGNVSSIITEIYIINGAPAIDLIGQYVNETDNPLVPKYDKNAINDGQAGVNKFGVYSPVGIAMDSVNHRLFLSELYNNRVLIYNLTTSNILPDRIPDNVLGQKTFTSNGISNSSTAQFGMNGPSGITYDAGNNRLYVADVLSNNRVLVFNTSTISNGMNAVNVLGKKDFAGTNTANTQSGMYGVHWAAYNDANRLFVADSNRVLVFNTSTISNGMNALNVLGQAAFGTNAFTTSQAGMNHVSDLAYDAENSRLFVGDYNNHRVLVFNTSTVSNGMNAVNVLGQTTFSSNTILVGQSGFFGSSGLAYDSINSRLFLSDYNDNRVLVFNTSTTSNGMNAVNVLGQTTFGLVGANTTQSGMNGPSGIAYDAGNKRLYVTDSTNNRVMIFFTP